MRFRRILGKAERQKAAAKLKSERRMAKRAKIAASRARLAEPRQDHYDPSARTPLLDLPPELRNRIWTYATQCPEESKSVSIYLAKPPPLTRTCLQIRNEAGSIFWGQTFDFIVGCNALQRSRYTSTAHLKDHPGAGEISQHEFARMRQAGTLGLSSTLLKRLRDPLLQARFSSFVINACDESNLESRRKAARRPGNTRYWPFGWTLRLAIRVDSDAVWTVNYTIEDSRLSDYGKPVANEWNELFDAIVDDARSVVKEIEDEGDAARGMSIDQIARVALALRFDIMVVRDVHGNAVMEDPADASFGRSRGWRI